METELKVGMTGQSTKDIGKMGKWKDMDTIFKLMVIRILDLGRTISSMDKVSKH